MRRDDLIHEGNEDFPVKISLVNMTPEWAADILANQNTNNREIRPGHVNMLYKAFERGEYVLTHQGIAFDENDILVDGQHRLKAITKQPPDAVFPMVMFRGLPARAFYVIDTTVAKRNLGDVAHVEKRYGETASFIARMYTGSARNSSVAFAHKFLEYIKTEYDLIEEQVTPSAKNWGAASIRAAAVLAVKHFGPDAVITPYKNLVTGQIDLLPPIFQHIQLAKENQLFSALQPQMQFMRFFNAFDPSQRDKETSDITSERKIQLTAIVTQMISNYVLGSESGAETSREHGYGTTLNA